MSRTRRSRSRSRGGAGRGIAVALVVVTVLVAVFAAGPTDAFTSGTLDRGSTVGVADDANGLVGLDISSSVAAGESSSLVTVTNRLDRTTTVTVTLDTASAGSLSNAQATLSPGESVTTTATVACDEPPDAVTFTVESTADSQFTGLATRSTSVDTSSCTTATPPIVFDSGSATTGTFSGPGGDSTGSLAFSIRNTESTPRTITGFELQQAGDATQLGFDGPPPVNTERGKDEFYVDATGGATDSQGAAEASKGVAGFEVGTGITYSLDESVTLDAGETARVLLYRFVSNGQAYSFESGDEIELLLSFQDGTETTVTFTV